MLFLSKILTLVTGKINSSSIRKTYEQNDFEYQRDDNESASYSDYDANSGYDDYSGHINGIIQIKLYTIKTFNFIILKTLKFSIQLIVCLKQRIFIAWFYKVKIIILKPKT